jgi:hypothetical protein
LGYTDKKAKGKGVTLDVNTQMVVLQLKKGVTPNPANIAQAFIDAGYAPVTLYKPVLKGKEISLTTIKLGR